MTKTYVLTGPPVPLARARFASGKVYDSQKKSKMGSGILLSRQHDTDPIFQGPLELDICFYFAICKSHHKKIKELCNTPHFFKPDLSNLIKFVEDVANRIIYHDDCQIATINAKKLYCDIGDERTVFTIKEINGKKE